MHLDGTDSASLRAEFAKAAHESYSHTTIAFIDFHQDVMKGENEFHSLLSRLEFKPECQYRNYERYDGGEKPQNPFADKWAPWEVLEYIRNKQ
jgi:hypothetical protein